MAAVATFVVDFGSLTDAFLVAELDEDKNGGKTSFAKGDSVHFKIYADVGYTIETTAGSVNGVPGNSIGAGVVEAEVMLFVKGESASASKQVESITSVLWYGNHLGTLSATNTTVQASLADKDTLGIAAVDYTTEYSEHTLVPPGTMTDTYHILVYIKAVP